MTAPSQLREPVLPFRLIRSDFEPSGWQGTIAASSSSLHPGWLNPLRPFNLMTMLASTPRVFVAQWPGRCLFSILTNDMPCQLLQRQTLYRYASKTQSSQRTNQTLNNHFHIFRIHFDQTAFPFILALNFRPKCVARSFWYLFSPSPQWAYLCPRGIPTLQMVWYHDKTPDHYVNNH